MNLLEILLIVILLSVMIRTTNQKTAVPKNQDEDGTLFKNNQSIIKITIVMRIIHIMDL